MFHLNVIIIYKIRVLPRPYLHIYLQYLDLLREKKMDALRCVLAV